MTGTPIDPAFLEAIIQALEDAGSSEIASTRCHQVAEAGSDKLHLARQLRAMVGPVVGERRTLYAVHITRLQRVDQLLHEAERWASAPEMERVLGEAIVLTRGIVYPVGDDPTLPLEDDHLRAGLRRLAGEGT